MKRKSFLFCLFLLISINLYSLDRNIFNMKLSTEFGLLNGELNEYVFSEDCKNTGNKLSQLVWDVDFIPYFEGNATFNFIKYIYLNVNGRIGIPADSGRMKDYDWLNSVTFQWRNDDPTERTNFSSHYNNLNRYYNWSVKTGGNIPIGRKVTLTPYIGYKYDFIEMTATGGYAKYKSYNYETKYFTGKTITYAQESNDLILGLNFELTAIPHVPIETYFQVVPTVGKMIALDKHHTRTEGSHPYGLAFLDKYEKYFQLDFKIAAFYEFNKYHRLGLSSFIHYMPLTKGSTGAGAINQNGSIPSKFTGDERTMGGAKRFLYSFGIVYQFKL